MQVFQPYEKDGTRYITMYIYPGTHKLDDRTNWTLIPAPENGPYHACVLASDPGNLPVTHPPGDCVAESGSYTTWR